MTKRSQGLMGFTIVELLIVVVVIAILAAITIVSYNGITKQAQRAVVDNTRASTTKSLEAYKITNSTYPDSIQDCPTPGGTNLCISTGNNMTMTYAKVSKGTRSLLGRTNQVADESYELSVRGERACVYASPMQQRSVNASGREFMQYTDLAPFIDSCGVRPYTLSFDIRSANTATASSVRVYFQNGSSARYLMTDQYVQVTTDWKRYQLEFTPTLHDTSLTSAMLAFYGTYNTGNEPEVRNVWVELK